MRTCPIIVCFIAVVNKLFVNLYLTRFEVFPERKLKGKWELQGVAGVCRGMTVIMKPEDM